jgi:hypothetical protein
VNGIVFSLHASVAGSCETDNGKKQLHTIDQPERVSFLCRLRKRSLVPKRRVFIQEQDDEKGQNMRQFRKTF